MENTKERIILLLTFLIAFGFRLAFIFRVPHFSSDQAYFHLRHSEHIAQNFFPIVFDPLSYGGNLIVDTHFFHFILGLLDVFFSQGLVYKILPALLASSMVVIVYLLAKQITKNQYASFFAALLAAFIPTYIGSTINQISVTSMYIPVLLMLLIALISIKKHKGLFLALAAILVLLEPLNMLMLFTLIIFVALLISESVKIRNEEKEAIGFFIAFFFMVNLFLFRVLYFDQGLGAVWQNLPLELYGSLFQNFNLFTTISLIGIVPLLFGTVGLILAKPKDKSTILLKSVLLAAFTLLLLKLIAFVRCEPSAKRKRVKES